MSHNHDHDTHHHHSHSECGCRKPAPFEPQDAAGKSLTSALQTSFRILKVIMIILVVLFLASGIFKVQQDEQALVLIFGSLEDALGGKRVLNPGLQRTWPEPISEIIRIPVGKVQTLNVDSFWYFETEQEKLGQKNMYFSNTLDPIKDGYSLTRSESSTETEGMDYNIVHSRWTVTYSINRPELFFANIFYDQPKPGEDFLDATAKTVKPILESFMSNAVVSTMVEYGIDDAVTSKTDISEAVKRRLQARLEGIECGIKIDDVRADRIVWPRQVDDAFTASIQAGQQSKTAVTDASAFKDNLLTDTAGPDAETLLAKLREPGLTPQQKEELVAPMKGRVQGLISEARAYKTRVVEETRANADYLNKLLPEYKKRPQLVLQRLYQDAMEEVMAAADEKIMLQPGAGQNGREIRIQINRDPKAQKKQTQEQGTQK
jgi:membrane protease subunit HflK